MSFRLRFLTGLGCALLCLFGPLMVVVSQAGPQAQTFIYLPIALRPASAAEQPALQLKLDEATGASQFVDAVTQSAGASCAVSACPKTGLAGKIGTFAKFDGVDDVIRASDRAALNVAATDDLSIEAWIYPESHRCGYCRLVNKFDGSRGYVLDLADNAGHTALSFYASDGAHASLTRSSLNVLLNAWHQVVVVVARGSGVARLYIDGSELPYQTQQTLAGLGDLSNTSELLIGKLGNETSAYQGLLDQVALYKRALSASEITTHFNATTPGRSANFHVWNSDQALTVFKGFSATVAGATPLLASDMAGLPVLPGEGARFQLPASVCANCTATLLTFTSAPDWAQALAQLNASSTRAYGVDNVILLALDANALANMSVYTQALTTGMVESIFDAPTNATTADFEPWSSYYPASRGQQRDAANHKAQRTYDRWDGPNNQWLYGQSTWLYQDPDVADAPPPGLPATFEGRPIDYFIQAHCEKDKAVLSHQDCVNLEIFIETLSAGADDTELLNWWSGGWAQLITTTPSLWTFYNPAAPGIAGDCSKAHVQAQATDADLQNGANRVPLRFRLPNTPGAVFYSPAVCAIITTSYLNRVSDVATVNTWRMAARLLASTVDTVTARSTLQADNRYFERLAAVDGDLVYRQWAREVYWMREIKPQARLDGGFEALWWWNWPLPVEQNREVDSTPLWSNFEWCHLDKSQGPPGWGHLVCDPAS